MPSLSLEDIEAMQIKEIERRILFFNKIKKDRKNVELKNFISILHLAISAGSNSSKKNNRIFYEQLDKIFSNEKKQPENEQSLQELMGLVNVKK